MFIQKPLIMKKNQFTLMAVTFISGIILGVSVLGLISFTGSAVVPAPLPAVTKISVQDANTLFKAYYNTATPTNQVVRGFTINKDELSALNSLSAENPGLAGFRIYLGTDNTSGSVGIIVGVGNTGMDVTTSIYRSAAISSGPCPTICDVNSSITRN